MRTDQHGVPIHGALAAYPGWLRHRAAPTTQLTADLDYASAGRGLLATFPLPAPAAELDVTLA